MDGGISAIALTIIKLGAALGASTGLITMVKWFNTHDHKTTAKKGGRESVSDNLDHIRERAGSKNKLY